MRAEARFLVWIGAAASLTLVTAPNFVGLLDQSLGDTFGSIFPAIPFAALLTLIFALRWSDLRELLLEERGVTSQRAARALGGSALLALWALEPFTSQSVVSAGLAVVLTFYASSVVINPSTKRFLLPYAAIYAAGVGAPFALQWAFGEPLAVVSADLSARMVGVFGFPVVWQGTEFQLLSRTGDVIYGVVTPGCSSIISVTTFLGLLALMHMDLRKDLKSTASLAVVGIVALTILNSVRILVLMWVGYVDGAAAFWGIHNWIGYALFLGFYLAALPVYSKMGRPGSAAYSAISGTPYTPS
ncbi:MAG: exosortase/archaeosortase family protein [Nitrososphaerota archaeon]|nr:exosortase/archaeosortase family protein [Nitrososphaerota archaeon]